MVKKLHDPHHHDKTSDVAMGFGEVSGASMKKVPIH